ncbi:DUF2147 domain-containing protein [Sphingomonas hengshuiensis]|uniref:DUF2147 domain-containing protein n=1 Tax=Sphingomonas hengshuiensis TaxID=1609977 RepID=A0A7U5BF60_9SPHN|nr:DUF2147 domain-containing protein [Sphingomonas hengshuiensis]AJP74141.1 hypothetical protein TS85_23635 [Sphingomonas hengshuiensis]
MRRLAALALLLAATPAAAQGPVAPPDPVFGTWANPKHSIEVRTALCGADLCGAIVAASPQAEQDARDAGIDRLIGIELLRDYRKTGDARWSGTVFVPDMGRSFTSRIVQVSPNLLRISGCILGGLICKSQDWTRV